MNQLLFSQILDSLKFLVGLFSLLYGFLNEQNQFFMILGGFLIAISGIEINIGKTKNVKSPSKRKHSK